MIREYQGVKSISGPLLLVEGVAGVKYQELVEIRLADGRVRRGQVLEADGDRALVQVFEGTTGIDVPTTRVRFLGRGITLALAPGLLGRVFDGLGRPRDKGPELIPDARADVNGPPMKPHAPAYTNQIKHTRGAAHHASIPTYSSRPASRPSTA